MILNIPIAYTFITRIRNYRALLGYLAFEVAPLLLAAKLSGRAPIGILLLYILGLNIYEIGYIFNDSKDRNTKGELTVPDPQADRGFWLYFRACCLHWS